MAFSGLFDLFCVFGAWYPRKRLKSPSRGFICGPQDQNQTDSTSADQFVATAYPHLVSPPLNTKRNTQAVHSNEKLREKLRRNTTYTSQRWDVQDGCFRLLQVVYLLILFFVFSWVRRKILLPGSVLKKKHKQWHTERNSERNAKRNTTYTSQRWDVQDGCFRLLQVVYLPDSLLLCFRLLQFVYLLILFSCVFLS